MPQYTGRVKHRRIVLPVALAPPARDLALNFREVDALLDTGATTSGIRRDWARLLGLDSQGKRPIGFGGGEEQVDRYVFRIGLTAPEEPLPFVFDVEGFELKDSFSCAALLGMDVLEQCDFALSHDRRWTLRYGFT